MKKWIYNALIVLFTATALVSAGLLTAYFLDANKQARRYNDLSALKGAEPRPTVSQDADTDPQAQDPGAVLPQFSQLYEMNSDLIGWLSVPGTDINYPVMQTPDEPDYYLSHNFDKESNSHGCLYARASCDVASGHNVTIYGHRMRDGSMFAQLDKYMDQSFFSQYPLIYFDTLHQLRTYQVMAVFLTSATPDAGFAYHEFETADNEEAYNRFVSQCKELALYDTGVTAAYGDRLITLSTCEYSQTNGRLVVVAKQIA